MLGSQHEQRRERILRDDRFGTTNDRVRITTLYSVSQFQMRVGTQNEKWQATKLLHVAMDVCEEQIRGGRYFLHEHPLEAS